MKNRRHLRVNHETSLHLDQDPAKVLFSTYARGDVFHRLGEEHDRDEVRCPIGMATGAVFYPLEADTPRQVRIEIPLDGEIRRGLRCRVCRPQTWTQSLLTAARVQLPDERMQYLYDTAVRTLILFSACEIVPGPYTYRRFWFRDAVMMINAMLTLNLLDRCTPQLDLFFQRQQHSGYFAFQAGEWDSNGQALWLFDRFQRAAPDRFDQRWMAGIINAALWIRKKRQLHKTGLHAGLLPAGFSAEHLGPNDYYYWDDFWSIAGLHGAGRLAGLFADAETVDAIMDTALNLEAATFRSIAGIPRRRSRGAIPASPYRRMDAGAVGSLAVDYPLQLTSAGNARVKATADYLIDHCFFNGGFFQDMIHSGINAYLTLSIAQTLLRNGDRRYKDLMNAVARLASGTGQWPEAVHPATLGRCMGDGHHGWAAAEWVMMIRNCFVREEKKTLVIGSGLFEEWLRAGQTLAFGPTPTCFGDVSVEIRVEEDACEVSLQNRWTGDAPRVLLQLSGFEEKELTSGASRLERRPHGIHSG